jgi:4-amino-4-deoxy-L-arabinose transferase-like glycosyltransferase
MGILRIALAVFVLVLAIHLGGFPVMDTDEGRNAEVAREMAESNDYVVPRYNGLPYLDKPVLYFAAQAALMEFLGPIELAARFPAYLFTIATAGVLFFFARRLWGEEAGLIAAIVHLAVPLTVAFSRIVIFDSALTFFSIVALATFYLAVEERNSRWAIVAWLALGLAMITKGPVAFLLVLPPAFFFARHRGAMRLLFPLLGIVLFAAVVAPWVWGMSQVVPEFLRYVLVTETVERMATDELARTGPPWYFVPYVIGGALPWSFVLLFSWRKLRERDPALLYWLLAIAIPLIFFSLSQSKRPQYVLPLMPAMALVIARIWDEARTKGAALAVGVLGLILIAGSAFAGRTALRPEVRIVADETAIALGVVLLAACAGGLFLRQRKLVLLAFALPAILLPLCANPILRAIAERRSAKGFVHELQPHLAKPTHIIGVEAFTGSLVFYLRQPITLVTEDASELTSNYLVRRHEQFIGAPSSPLEPLSYFQQSLTARHRRVYIVRIGDVARRTLLESRGWRVLADSSHIVAYGE